MISPLPKLRLRSVCNGRGDSPYADLGRPDAGEMLVKAGPAQEIAQILKSRRLAQQRAADLLGISQPKLPDL